MARTGKRMWRQGRCSAVVAPFALGLTVAPAAAQTKAGTAIDNVADAAYRLAGAEPVRQPSNVVRLIVAERLDVTLAATGPAADVADHAVWPIALRNTGNGDEAFTLEPGAPNGSGVQIAIDVDGDGRFDPAHDRLISGTSPVLAPGEGVALLMLVTPAAGGSGGEAALSLTASAVTGSGAAGTVFAEKGDGGGDAVVGQTGATARVTTALLAGAAPQLVKSQIALAPDGSARAISGAIVTYTLEARFAAATPAARIEDGVPAGTTLVPGSLQLDGTALSDAADGDPGTADAAAGIAVALGDIPGPATRRVQFKVQIR